MHHFPCILDLPLFLVRKSHVDSVNKKLEWRLSFSVIEKEIINKIPQIPKRAFMICKELMAFKVFQGLYGDDSDSSKLWQSFFLKESNDFGLNVRKTLLRLDGLPPDKEIDSISKTIKEKYNPLTTYHWKTALLRKMDESWGAAKLSPKHLYSLVRELIEFVLDAVKAKSMSNYFVPGMDLYYKFTKKEEDGQFERSKVFLEEMLSDFPETVKSLLFTTVNIRHHLLPYQKFDEFHQEVNNISKVLLLEGYYTFLTSMFTSDLKQPRDWKNSEDNRMHQISIKDTYFLTRMASDLGLIKHRLTCDFNIGFSLLISSLLNDFPLTRFVFSSAFRHMQLEDINKQYNIHGRRDAFLEFIRKDPEMSDKQFNKITEHLTSNMARMFVLAQHLYPFNPRAALNKSVVKYIQENGEINISLLNTNIRQAVSSNEYHKFCENVVGLLRQYSFKQIMTLSKRLRHEDNNSNGKKKIWQEPHLSDLLSTPIDLFLKILNVGLKKENNDWVTERFKLVNFKF